jgi:hypothetical protein
MDLTFTAGGNANWASVRPDCSDPNYGGPDSAKSGSIGNSQQTWLKTTVNGEGWIKFYWKVSSQSGDYLKLYIDGSYKTSISGNVDWTKKTYYLDGLGHTIEWRYVKNSSGSSGDDCGWVDRVEW